jgi:prolyl oligopeptidase
VFDPFLRVWFDLGGVFAAANIRGGGEYGEPWHRAGMLEKKQNTLDDFAACAQRLIDDKVTDSAHLGVWGASNGGITVGGLITQHPDLVRAAVIQVGVLDVVRSELEPNGVFNVTEYGTVRNPAEYRAIRAYSPYQNVRDHVPYPAVLLLAGENDHRVASWHAKKMAARLEAATSSGRPILLRTSATAGHGFGTAFGERLQERADILSFLADQLGAAAGSSSAPAHKAKKR